MSQPVHFVDVSSVCQPYLSSNSCVGVPVEGEAEDGLVHLPLLDHVVEHWGDSVLDEWCISHCDKMPRIINGFMKLQYKLDIKSPLMALINIQV